MKLHICNACMQRTNTPCRINYYIMVTLDAQLMCAPCMQTDTAIMLYICFPPHRCVAIDACSRITFYSIIMHIIQWNISITAHTPCTYASIFVMYREIPLLQRYNKFHMALCVSSIERLHCSSFLRIYSTVSSSTLLCHRQHLCTIRSIILHTWALITS